MKLKMHYISLIKPIDYTIPNHFVSAADIGLYREFIESIEFNIYEMNEYITEYNLAENPEEQLSILKDIFELNQAMNSTYPLEYMAYCPSYCVQIHENLWEELQKECQRLKLKSVNALVKYREDSSCYVNEFISNMHYSMLTRFAATFWENKNIKSLENMFPDFITTNKLTVLEGKNSRNVLIESTLSPELPWVVLKIDPRLDHPKAHEHELRNSNFPHLIKTYGEERLITFQNNGKPQTATVTITDFCPQGDLELFAHKLSGEPTFEIIKNAIRYFGQMAAILLEMHSHGFALTDAKNANWLLDRDQKLKIGDTKSLLAITPNNGLVSLKSEENKWSRGRFVSTNHLYPPEFLSPSKEPFAPDAMASYMLGKNLYHFITLCGHEKLWDISPDRIKKINPKSSFNDSDFNHRVFQEPLGNELRILIEKLVQPEPKNRLPLKDALQKLKKLEALQRTMHMVCAPEMEEVVRFMQDQNLHPRSKLNYLIRLDEDALLYPFIRKLWKKERKENISSKFFCDTSAAECAYRAIQKTYDTILYSSYERVLAVFSIVRKFTLTDANRQLPFSQDLISFFGHELIVNPDIPKLSIENISQSCLK